VHHKKVCQPTSRGRQCAVSSTHHHWHRRRYIGALGGAIPLTDIENAAYSLFKWAQQVLDLPAEQIPMVMSVSYGNDESQQTSKAYMLQCNTQFQKMGAAGISVIFASGDQGVQGRSGPGPRYNPDFPAASPYITAVGGTDFVTKGTIGPEKAWTQGGGGFSDTFPIPVSTPSHPTL
jgi:tripeptidyl-peptidase-1